MENILGQYSNYVPYVIYNDSIPEAIESLKELIKEYKKETKNKKLTINTTSDDFWQMVDTDWYQKKENGLLSSRISMGLEIVQFNKKYPDDDISFTAEF